MSYVTSNAAVLGYGAVLGIGPLTSAVSGTPTYVPIYEITDLSFPESEREILKTTNFNSPLGQVEKLGNAIDNGAVTFSYNYVSTDPGQQALLAANLAGEGQPYAFQLSLPKNPKQTTIGDVITFNAIIKNAGGFDVSTEKQAMGKATLEISGPYTRTEGS